LAEIPDGGVLGLFGFGASAHIALQVARHRGCDVFVFTRGEDHRRVALELGAAWAGGTEDEPPAPLDAAVSFAPAGSVVAAALRRLGRGGTLAINAIWLDGLPAMDYTGHLYWERTVRSVTNLTHADAREFLALAGRVSLQMVVEEFPLREANDVLRRMKESRLEAAAALLPERAG
jgi:propanol-preferring alcohol dehydrogenase